MINKSLYHEGIMLSSWKNILVLTVVKFLNIILSPRTISIAVVIAPLVVVKGLQEVGFGVM